MSYLRKLTSIIGTQPIKSRNQQTDSQSDAMPGLDTEMDIKKGAEPMHQPSLGVCLEGVPWILYTAFASLILALLGWKLPALLLLIGTLLILHFFRDPERVVPLEEQAVVSPADGKIVSLERRAEPLSQEMRQKIGIFMNVFDVHVNRSPVQGRIQKIQYVPGKFMNASLDKASKDNERNILQIEDKQGRRWTVVQIAGLVARRIICRVQVQDQLQQGQRLGLIKFGSRVDLYLPEGYEILVARGDRVYAGQTILARAEQNSATKGE